MRVNSVESGLCGADLEAVLGGDHLPSALHLPKVRDRAELELVWRTTERLHSAIVAETCPCGIGRHP